jgi:hypothetical protein
MAQEVGDMTLVLDCLAALLAAFGLFCLGGLVYGRMVLPVAGPTLAVIPARGNGEALEQTVAGLLWLRRAGLWRGTIIIQDRGLTPEGLALARQLSRKDEVEVRTGPDGLFDRD